MTRTRLHAVEALEALAADLRGTARSGQPADRVRWQELWDVARAAFPTIPPPPDDQDVGPRVLRQYAEAYQAVARRYR